jgi:hypothetical protein
MRLQVLSVLGKGTERRMDALAMFWGLKLLGIETPGKGTGQRPEEGVHGGLDATPLGAILGDSPPLEERGEEYNKDDDKSCQSH